MKRVSENHFTERCTHANDIALTGGDIADIFTVSGGPVLCLGIYVFITTAVSNNACLIHFEADPTVGAANVDIAEGAGAPDIALAALGEWFYTDGDSQDVMVKCVQANDLPMMANNNGGIVIPEGGIDLKLSTSNPTTGAASIYIRYKPLTVDARIT